MIPEKIGAPFGKTVLSSFLGGLLLASIGGAIGFFSARINEPTGWSENPSLLSDLIYGYGPGAGVGGFALNFRPHPASAFSRAFLSALTGLLGVIFLSAPLHLDFYTPLMWGLLVLLPPLISARLLVSPNDGK